jgi:hypothetical protein
MMIGTVIWDAGGSQRTYTLPTGWTLIKDVYINNGSGITFQMVVAYKTIASGDGSSYAGTISASTATAAACVSAYSGVQGIGTSNSGTAGVATSVSTGSATSAVANSWRVTAGGYSSGSASYTISSNEVSRRSTFTADDSGDTGALQGSLWDSNATVAASSFSRTVSRSANWSAGLAAIFYITPVTGTPATGTFENTLAHVTSDAAGEVHDDATVAASLPAVVASLAGYGQPPVVTSDMAAALAPVVAAFEGGTVVSGTLAAGITVSADAEGETRAFGVRVIVVDADDRTIVVESRGVAD